MKTNANNLISFILNYEIEGNAHSDRPLLDACHEILMDDNRPHSQHAVALRKLDEAMGLDPTPTDRAAVLNYRKNVVGTEE